MTLDQTSDPTFDRLLDLLPVHYVSRDAMADGSPGPLTALLTAVARELEILEADAARLADAWFVETCEEWLVPYLADLVGLADVPPDLGPVASRRALVANTVAYRRRKGTLAVLEQVARDVTGWPSRAVEYHPLLVVSTHVKHVRLERLAVSGVRSAEPGDLALAANPPAARGALDPLAHTAEVRRIAARRGRYGIANVGVFPFSTRVAIVGEPPRGSSAAAGPAGGWSRTRARAAWHLFDPLGRRIPLFMPPVREPAIETLAGEPELPVPLRPRRLLALLQAARAGRLAPSALPLGVRIGATGTDLAPDRIRVCGLEALAAGDDPQVAVDPVAGSLRAFHGGGAYVPSVVYVRYAYGASAEVGAGPWDRSERHQALLDSDSWTPPVATGGAPPVDIQFAVSSDAPTGTPNTVTTLPDGLTAIEAAWSAPGSTALAATATVSVANSDRYAGDVSVDVPVGTRLVLVGARWPTRVLPDGVVRAPVPGRYAPDSVRPHVLGSLRITGAAGASVVLDGLVIEGDVEVQAGQLGALTVAHCTTTGTIRVLAGAGGNNAALSVRLVRSVVGALDAAGTVPSVAVTESIIDPGALPAGTPALRASGAHTTFDGCTVVGPVSTRSLDATSCLLDGTVHAAHRQVGCVRFSYVTPGSRTPRRYRCVPADGTSATPRPVYVASDPASPAYRRLARSCAAEIRTGGERESEMGVHHHLFRPLLVAATERQLAGYLTVGSQLGVFGT